MRHARLAVALLLLCGCAAESQLARRHAEDGRHLFARGNYADAGDCFRAALALKPGDADLLFEVGRCHGKLGQIAQAEALYKDCVARDPDHADARHAWLVLMLGDRREAEGRAMVAAWMRSRPDRGGPYAEDAFLFARAGDVDNARGRYQQALDRDPNEVRALVGLASVYEKIGRKDRSLELYVRALHVRRDQPDVARRVEELRRAGVTGPKPD